jgi:hypothetical protein
MSKILGNLGISALSLIIFSAYASDSTTGEPPKNLSIVTYQMSSVGTAIAAVLPKDGEPSYCSGNNPAYFFYGVGMQGDTNYWGCNTLSAGFQEQAHG